MSLYEHLWLCSSNNPSGPSESTERKQVESCHSSYDNLPAYDEVGESRPQTSSPRYSSDELCVRHWGDFDFVVVIVVAVVLVVNLVALFIYLFVCSVICFAYLFVCLFVCAVILFFLVLMYLLSQLFVCEVILFVLFLKHFLG